MRIYRGATGLRRYVAARHPEVLASRVGDMLRRMRPNVLTVAVDCYAGYQGEQTPRRFTRGDQIVEILAIVTQWRTPDHRYFRVRTAGETCTLRQDVTLGGWELTESGRSDPR